MPAFEKKLKEEEIKKLVSFILEMAKKKQLRFTAGPATRRKAEFT